MERSNSFDELRLILALIVVVAHLGALTQLPSIQIVSQYFDSEFAVKCFFVISGYFVLKSFIDNPLLFSYFRKRVNRIYPAYIFVVVITFLVGFSNVGLSFSDYVFSNETVRYFLANSVFLNFIQPSVHNVFKDNPMSNFNGAFWTLKVEVMFYILVPIIAIAIKSAGYKLVLSVAYLFGVIWSLIFSEYDSRLAHQLPGQMAYFAVGMFFVYFDVNRLNHYWFWVAIISYFCLPIPHYLEVMLSPVVYGGVIFLVGQSTLIRTKITQLGDFSYSIYLIHYPIIQFSVSFGLFESGVWFGFTITMLLVFCLASFIWFLIERPFIRSKKFLGLIK